MVPHCWDIIVKWNMGENGKKDIEESSRGQILKGLIWEHMKQLDNEQGKQFDNLILKLKMGKKILC